MVRFETQYPDMAADMDWQPARAGSAIQAAAERADRYIAETDAFHVREQPFVDIIAVREIGRPETERQFKVTARIYWTATEGDWA